MGSNRGKIFVATEEFNDRSGESRGGRRVCLCATSWAPEPAGVSPLSCRGVSSLHCSYTALSHNRYSGKCSSSAARKANAAHERRRIICSSRCRSSLHSAGWREAEKDRQSAFGARRRLNPASLNRPCSGAAEKCGHCEIVDHMLPEVGYFERKIGALSLSFSAATAAPDLAFEGRGAITRLDHARAQRRIIRRLANGVVQLDLGRVPISFRQISLGVLDRGGTLGSRGRADNRQQGAGQSQGTPQTIRSSPEYAFPFIRKRSSPPDHRSGNSMASLS